jgi:hypothetical protein
MQGRSSDMTTRRSVFKNAGADVTGKYCLSTFSDAAGNETNYSYSWLHEFDLLGGTAENNTY